VSNRLTAERVHQGDQPGFTGKRAPRVERAAGERGMQPRADHRQAARHRAGIQAQRLADQPMREAFLDHLQQRAVGFAQVEPRFGLFDRCFPRPRRPGLGLKFIQIKDLHMPSRV